MASARLAVSQPHPRRQPTFFWQGLLIILPILVLAGLGGISLRQDRILAQHEAPEQAQAIPEQFVQSIWTGLTALRDQGRPWFQIDWAGCMLFRPPFPEVSG